MFAIQEMTQRALRFNFLVIPAHTAFAFGAAMHFCRCAAEVLRSQPAYFGWVRGCSGRSVAGCVPGPGGKAALLRFGRK